MPKKFISQREDKKGHRLPLTEKEKSLPYSIIMPISERKALQEIGPNVVRPHLRKLIKKHNNKGLG